MVLLTSVLCLLSGSESWASQKLEDDRFSAKFRQALKTWTGDWDGMVTRNQVRVLIPFSKTFYFLDGGRQRGLTYDLMKIFAKQVNDDLKRKTVQVQFVFIPVNRDELIPGLLNGIGDIAAGALTITPERTKLIDFSEPVLTHVREIIVTGPSSPTLSRLDDLAGKTIHVRRSSSFYEHLIRLNEKFKRDGNPEIKLVPEEENLEDEDLLEMVNAGLLPMLVMDSPKAEFWANIFENIRLHPDIAVNTDGEIAWAFRKNSPKLKKVINRFVRHNKKGTLIGNLLFTRYLKNTKYVTNALATQERKKFQNLMHVFKKTAGQYGFDWVLAMALGYQESTLDQRKRSSAGAIGVMQLLPSTARDPTVNIPNIKQLEPNIHAGVKYLHFLHDRYFKDQDMDIWNQWFFAVASYNAGPARIAKLRAEAPSMGLNPNKWFKNVELVAAKRIGRETVQYVSNIYKYFIAYRLILEKEKMKEMGHN
ncbi:MAG TPA: lytic transglycosylase F [Nitrospirales bacterium]|nr:lytic transglycosylase F [Nitrospirales bacterium]